MKEICRYISILGICIFFLMVLNYDNFIYQQNQTLYQKVDAEVTETKDGLFSVLPKYKVSYVYKDKPYEGKRVSYESFFVAIPRFYRDYTKDNTGEIPSVYVNIESPQSFLLLVDMKHSFINKILIGIGILAVCLIIHSILCDIKRIIKRIQNKRKKRQIKNKIQIR